MAIGDHVEEMADPDSPYYGDGGDYVGGPPPRGGCLPWPLGLLAVLLAAAALRGRRR